MAGSRYFENRMTLRDVDLSGKRILVRVDFNVPLSKDGTVTDDFRIRAALPTLKYILDNGGIPILVSHLGRPGGKVVPDLSLRPVRDSVEELSGTRVILAPDCVGDEVKRMAESLSQGEMLLLENTRFHSEEKDNDPEFSKHLASLAGLFVNDAFGTAHRAHASTEGVTHYLQPAVAGFLIENELEFFGKLMSDPGRPFIAIIGGAKISGKIEALKNLLDRVDALLVGGGIANTFLKAQGRDIGSSLYEESAVDVAAQILDLAMSKGVDLVLPEDMVIADKVAEGAETDLVADDRPVPQGFSIVDVGERTVVKFSGLIGRAGTIFWNGPLGVFEIDHFSRGTVEIARAVAAASQGGAISVIGGGDTVSAVAKAGVTDMMTHISTGGGASLEFVEGRELPGIVALTRKGEG